MTIATASLLANDTDTESVVTFLNTTQPGDGVLSTDAAGDLVYTPDANFNGTDTFTYSITDGTAFDTATVTITVTAINDLPVANDDGVTTIEDTAVTVLIADLLLNDSDVESTPTIQSHTQPADGAITVDSSGDFTYTPDPNFDGTDTFTYTITDGTATDTATVTIVVTPVNDRPEGEDDLGWSVQQRTTLSILISDLLANDDDPEGEPLTIGTLLGSPDGTTNFSADGLSVEFTSDVEFAGRTIFAYQVCDPQGLCDLSNTQVEINVGNVNDPPVAMLDELPTVNEDQSLTFTAADLLANDDDPDLVHGSESLAVTIDFASVQNGTITSLGADTYRYQPNPNYFGIDDFSYLVTDAAGATSNTGQVKVPVLKVTEAPVAVDDGSNTSQLVTVEVGTTVTLPDLLANDTDDDDAPSALILNVPSQSALGASLSVNTASRVVYQAPTGAIGADTFTYTVTDSDGLTSAPATVHVELKNDLNQAPSGSPDVATTLEDQPVTLNWNGLSGLLTNDTDPDLAFGDTLAIASASAPNGGTVSVDAAAETVTYTPALNFTGPVVFTYIVCDASNACSLPTNVEVTVTDTPDNPIANDDEYVPGGRFETFQGTDLTVSVIEVRTNDFNPDDPTNANGGALTYTLIPDSTGTAPTTVLTTNGSLVTQSSPNAGFVVSPISTYHGEDSFDYQVCNLAGLCDTATVTINVADLNHNPSISISVPHNVFAPFTGAEDTDWVDIEPVVTDNIDAQTGDVHTWSIANGVLPDGLNLNAATGVISGRPAIGSSGNYPITLLVDDQSTVSPGALTGQINLIIEIVDWELSELHGDWLISEVRYRETADNFAETLRENWEDGTADSVGVLDEFIEIVNISGGPLDLDGLRLSDINPKQLDSSGNPVLDRFTVLNNDTGATATASQSFDVQFGPAIIPDGGHLVVWLSANGPYVEQATVDNDPTQPLFAYGVSPGPRRPGPHQVCICQRSPLLGNAGDEVFLIDASGRLVDFVAWTDTTNSAQQISEYPLGLAPSLTPVTIGSISEGVSISLANYNPAPGLVFSDPNCWERTTSGDATCNGAQPTDSYANPGDGEESYGQPNYPGAP